MSETVPETADEDVHDWAASDFGEADYVGDDQLAGMVELVADGEQNDTPNEKAGWASVLPPEASSATEED